MKKTGMFQVACRLTGPTGFVEDTAADGPALLGAVALESLLLAVDPVHQRLVPVTAFALTAA